MKMLIGLLLFLLPYSSYTAPVSCLNTFKTTASVKTAESRVIIFSAPSGGGKTTLMHKLISEFPDKFAASVSTTTRSPRTGEVNGKDYNFVTREEFQKQLGNNDFIESAEVHGNFYGTSRSQVESILTSGRSAILVIDVNGATNVRKQFPDNALSVFITPPNLQVLEARLRDRKTDSEEVIQKRLKNASSEMSRKGEFDTVIINDNLETAYKDLKRAIFR